MTLPPSGFIYNEFYLYANKQWDVVPSGSLSHTLASGVLQNAPVIITSSGYETTTPSEPWGQIGGSGRWTKRGHGFFTVTPAGVYDTSVNEFTMNPSAAGKIEFNQVLEIESPDNTNFKYFSKSCSISPNKKYIVAGAIKALNESAGLNDDSRAYIFKLED